MKRFIVLIVVFALAITAGICLISCETENTDNVDSGNNSSSINYGNWKRGDFVDEFDEPTGEKYIYNTIKNGKFSNSATTNSKLHATILITDKYVSFGLVEYGLSDVVGIFDSTAYEIKVQDEAQVTHIFNGYLAEGSRQIVLEAGDYNDFIKLIINNDNLKIHLQQEVILTSTYLFEIECDGYSEIYNDTF